METSKHHIEPAAGRLGVLIVGLGAVSSAVVAGVELIRRGLAEPIGSLTQMGTIRLGKRTEDRVPLIRAPEVIMKCGRLAAVHCTAYRCDVSVRYIEPTCS